MRIVIQRVQRALVRIDGQTHAEIGPGLLVLVGIEPADGPEDIIWLSSKLVRLRIFADAAGQMNLSIVETGGEMMVISQFTLFASTRKGNRPSFIQAAPPSIAEPLYQEFIRQLKRDLGRKIATGIFGADMKVELVNDGPVTILVDTKQRE